MCKKISSSDTNIEMFLADIFVEEWDEDGAGGTTPGPEVGDVEDPEVVDEEQEAGVDCCSRGGVLGHSARYF